MTLQLELEKFANSMQDEINRKVNDDGRPKDPWNHWTTDHLRRRLVDEFGEWMRTLPSSYREKLFNHLHSISFKTVPKHPEDRRLIHIANLAYMVKTSIDEKSDSVWNQ